MNTTGWAGRGINVNVLCPGQIATEINADIWDRPMGEKRLNGFARRRVMPVDSIDAMLLYLSSDAASHVTGSVLTIETGRRCESWDTRNRRFCLERDRT